jgi:hypothetical protein
VDSPDITGRLILITKVQKIWIDATPVCSSFSDTAYLFQVHSIPEFSTLMFTAGFYGLPGFCDEFHQEYALGFNFSLSSFPVNHGTWFTATDIGSYSGNAVSASIWDPAIAASRDSDNMNPYFSK